MKPMVSVIVPVYNAEQTIRRCVASILDQQFTDLELLLVDDGSTDGSGAICDEFAARDARVTAIHQKNAGVSAARNHALDLAQGVYLQFLDSDDWITPDATRSLVRAAEAHRCDLVIADFYRVVGERLSRKGDIDEDSLLTREEYAAHMMENPADFYYGVLWNKLFPGKGEEYATKLRDYTIALYKKCAEYALSRGIIIADTKFEFGLDEEGNVILGDEMLTPDSSRFWPLEGYEAGHGQPSFDKQFVRNWLLANPDSDYDLPQDVIDKTIAKYEEAYEMLTGKKL